LPQKASDDNNFKEIVDIDDDEHNEGGNNDISLIELVTLRLRKQFDLD
jgi:hypothetical protein